MSLSTKEINYFKSKLIRKITFFENLDLYYKNQKYLKYTNNVKDIFKLYTDFKDDEFENTAKDYSIKFLIKKKNLNESDYDWETIVNIFNTRKIPDNFDIHPKIKDTISYRNKLVTLYTSINYFIHVYDPKDKNLDRYHELLELLFKNTFANGFILQYKTGFLISTNAFREDFERVKKEFLEFIWSFKLECQIYENLNYIPFSFYHLPNSQYYSNETNCWEFPVFEDRSVEDYFDHLAVNYRQEMKRLEDTSFKTRVDRTIERLTKEIATIKEQQKKEQLEKHLAIEN